MAPHFNTAQFPLTSLRGGGAGKWPGMRGIASYAVRNGPNGPPFFEGAVEWLGLLQWTGQLLNYSRE